jgi:lipopolysaccharide/colanic/teichoic acid biosynthesis glycosyltransferase
MLPRSLIATPQVRPNMSVKKSRAARVISQRDRLGRLGEIALAFILVILTLPLMSIIALAVKLESEGPVIERQRRRGKDGRLVLLLKFRTVHIAQNGHFNGVRGGTTRVGEVLQYTRADELPKLFNVIRGETTLAHLMELD